MCKIEKRIKYGAVSQEVDIDGFTVADVCNKLRMAESFLQRAGGRDIKVNIDCDIEYGLYHCRVTLIGSRLETDEEAAIRVKEERESKQAKIAQLQKQLDKLKD